VAVVGGESFQRSIGHGGLSSSVPVFASVALRLCVHDHCLPL
jgi:hypothetical protein